MTTPHVSSFIIERMAQHRAPGFSLAIIRGQQIDWAQGYGVRDARQPDPVTPQTLFQAGSVSKPVAAFAALRLVQDGRLTLDDDLTCWLDSWQVPDNDSWQPRLTLRQVLSHSAGLTVHGFPGYARDAPLPNLVQVLCGAEPANTEAIRVDLIPGTRWRYSGGGYCVLQQLLMDVMDQPFPALMRDLVLAPLGMEHSTYEQPLPPDKEASAATGHRSGDLPVSGKWHVYPEMAAAGLWTTPSDLARFVLEIQRTMRGDNTPLLAAHLVRDMLSPQMDETIGTGEQIGLGVFLRGQGRAALFGHTGSDTGFLCLLDAYISQGFGAVMMMNAIAGDLIMEVTRAVADEYGWPAYAFPMPTPIPIDPAVLGRYEVRPNFHFIVTHSDGTLYLQPTGQDPIRLQPGSGGAFRMRAVDADVTFARDRAGMVTGLTVRQGKQDIPATKQ